MKTDIFKEFERDLGNNDAFVFRGPFSLLLFGFPWLYSADGDQLYSLFVSKDRDTYAIIDDDKYKGFARDKFSKFLRGDVRITSLKEEYNNIAKDAERLYKHYSVNDNLAEFDFSELQNGLKTTRNMISTLIADSIYMELFDEKVVLDLVDKKIGNKVSELWEDMTHPTTLSFENRRNKFILDTHAGIDLKDLSLKTQYIYTDYHAAKSLSFVEGQLSKIISEKKDISEKIKKHSEIIEKNKKSLQEKIKNEPQKIKDIVEYTQFVINHRDLRKDPISYLQTVMYNLASEIFKRIGLEQEKILNFIVDEIAEMKIDDLKRISKESDLRKNGVACLLRPDSNYDIYPVDFNEAVKRLEDIAYKTDHKGIDELKGNSASKGIVKGKVKIIIDPHNAVFNEGDILVTSMTRADFVPLMKKALAIITNEGGITCHAAIISRELKKPCIIGTKIATKVLKDGDLINVDANHGVVKIIKKAR